MRMAFIHGINNEANTARMIEDAWWDAIREGWKSAGLPDKPKPGIAVGYYADLLAGTTASKAVEMGSGAVSTGLAASLLQEYADAAGVTEAELEQAAAALGLPPEAVEQGVPHEGWVVGFASALEHILPTKGKWLARLFLRQAVTYINDKALAAKIDKTVADAIFGDRSDPVLIIAHSLGTVVSYRVLADQMTSGRNVELFLTLGSPLSVRMFKSILPVRGSVPTPPIKRWLNSRHAEDFVTLGRSITRTSIGFSGVEDSTEILNDTDDKHSVVHYLSSPGIAKAIHDLL